MRMKILVLGKEGMMRTQMASKTWREYKTREMKKTKEIRRPIKFMAGMLISMPAMNLAICANTY